MYFWCHSLQGAAINISRDKKKNHLNSGLLNVVAQFYSFDKFIAYDFLTPNKGIKAKTYFKINQNKKVKKWNPKV
ncbi:hypothetical protein RIR_jg4335.t1 [Rhizophagus irregularis DAOM 181602=DAOM 197198]|nr:hypothetical protein RIR_jg4335.t1 [Rhizophagus irregularis DAOM 181602=DAOM 197198]